MKEKKEEHKIKASDIFSKDVLATFKRIEKILKYIDDNSKKISTDSVEMRLALNSMNCKINSQQEEIDVINNQITHIFRKLKKQKNKKYPLNFNLIDDIKSYMINKPTL